MPSRFSFFMKLGLSIILVIFIFIFSLPTILNTDPGKKVGLHVINALIPGRLTVDKWHLSWTGHQSAEGFQLNDPDNQIVMVIETLNLKNPLWKIIAGQFKSGLSIHNGYFVFDVQDRKWNNLERALKHPLSLSAEPLKENQEDEQTERRKKRALLDFSPFIKPKDIPRHRFVISSGEASVTVNQNNVPTEITLSGQTTYGELKGNIKAKISQDKGLQKQPLEKILSESFPFIQLEANQFPPTFLDQLLIESSSKSKDFFSSLFGPFLNAQIATDPKNTFQINLESTFFSGDLKGKIAQDHLVVDNTATFTARITPELINPFFPKNIEITNEIPLTLELEKISFPTSYLTKPQNDYLQLTFGLNVIMADKTDIQTNRLGTLNIDHMKLQAFADHTNPYMTVKIMGDLSYYGRPSIINYENWIEKSKELKNLLPINK